MNNTVLLILSVILISPFLAIAWKIYSDTKKYKLNPYAVVVGLILLPLLIVTYGYTSDWIGIPGNINKVIYAIFGIILLCVSFWIIFQVLRYITLHFQSNSALKKLEKFSVIHKNKGITDKEFEDIKEKLRSQIIT